jgi:hypothetical protein
MVTVHNPGAVVRAYGDLDSGARTLGELGSVLLQDLETNVPEGGGPDRPS